MYLAYCNLNKLFCIVLKNWDNKSDSKKSSKLQHVKEIIINDTKFICFVIPTALYVSLERYFNLQNMPIVSIKLSLSLTLFYRLI